MSTTAQAIIGTALPFAVPLLLAAAELVALRRKGGRPDRDDDRRPPAPPEAPRPPGGQKPLPECLVPKLRAKGRERQLELV